MSYAATVTPEQRRKNRVNSGRRNEEQELLLSIISSVLRSPPTEYHREGLGVAENDSDDHKLHYFNGLHNIAALCLINIESPALTSLLLKQLAHTNLRDAMRYNTSSLHAVLRLTFLPLLQGIDTEVHDHIMKRNMEISCTFALSWATTWFGQEILDIEVASRLFDFFLVSHALMPM